MHEGSLVSVIVPTYNHGHLISRCLQSLFDQTYGKWEAIVVNNFSKDDTEKVVREFQSKPGGERIVLINFDNRGIIAAARNRGLQEAKGEYIAFLDSDDWWYPEKLAKCVAQFPAWDVVWHDLDAFSAKKNKVIGTNHGRKLNSPIFPDLLINNNGLNNSAVIVKRKLIDQVNGLCEDPELFAVEDFDLWLRLAKISERFCYLPLSLGAVWVEGNNISSASIQRIKLIANVYNRHMSELNEIDQKRSKLALAYIENRIYQSLGLKVSMRVYLRVIWGHPSLYLKSKSVFFLVRELITRFVSKLKPIRS